MSKPAPSRSVKPRWGRIAAALIAVAAVIALIVAIGPWGGSDSATTASAEESWSARANAFCADGIQETSALTRPAGARELAGDAEERIQIVAAVRDGIYTLGEPGELDPTLATVYVDSLSKDLDGLDAIGRAAASGGDYQALVTGFDEASGEPASRLGLDDCEAFAEAVAPPTT